jgi:hypothetical protein
VNDQHDDTLLDKAKRLFGMDDGHGAEAPTPTAATTRARGDEHGELVGEPHGPDEGHFVNDPPLDERPSLHPTSRDAGVSDAARAARASDVLDDPALRRDGFTETGAASGKVAMPGGEEPVVGDEDREDIGRLP